MFSYCGNNPICYGDPDGYYQIPSTKAFELTTLDSEGNSPWHPSLHIPNARPVETWREVAEITVDFGIEIARTDDFQDLTSTGKIYSGLRTMINAGVGLFMQDPLHAWDEIKAIYTLVNGFKKVVYGIAELFDWGEE